MTNEPKFTPGPWNYKGSEIISTHEKRGRPVSVVDLFGAMGGEDSDADAHLIAAAPDLYEALEHLQSVQNGPPLIRFEADWQEAMAKTKAALAKARGET